MIDSHRVHKFLSFYSHGYLNPITVFTKAFHRAFSWVTQPFPSGPVYNYTSRYLSSFHAYQLKIFKYILSIIYTAQSHHILLDLIILIYLQMRIVVILRYRCLTYSCALLISFVLRRVLFLGGNTHSGGSRKLFILEKTFWM